MPKTSLTIADQTVVFATLEPGKLISETAISSSIVNLFFSETLAVSYGFKFAMPKADQDVICQVGKSENGEYALVYDDPLRSAEVTYNASKLVCSHFTEAMNLQEGTDNWYARLPTQDERVAFAKMISQTAALEQDACWTEECSCNEYTKEHNLLKPLQIILFRQ